MSILVLIDKYEFLQTNLILLKSGTLFKNLLAQPSQSPKYIEWQPHWGAQTLCSYCDKPALSDCLFCKTCNSVTHFLCLEYYQHTGELRMSHPFSPNNNDHVCLNCRNFMEEEYINHRKAKEIDLDNQLKRLCAIKITRQVIIYLERKKLRRKIASIIFVQSHFRRYIVQRQHEIWKRSKLRTLVIELMNLPSKVITNGIVVLTGLDTFTNTQLIRIDKKGDVALKESFLIPGVTAQMSLYFTLAVRDESSGTGNQYIMISQGQLALRDVSGYMDKKILSISYVDKIKVVSIYGC